jgi:hypothetical protein
MSATKNALRALRACASVAGGGEGRVCGGGGKRPLEEQQHARRQPQRDDRGERRADGRGLAGPVAHGREQESDDDREGEAEDHLVRVPQGTRQSAAGVPAGKLRDPGADRERGEEGGAQVERAKAERPQREFPRARSPFLPDRMQTIHQASRTNDGNRLAIYSGIGLI